MKFWNKHQLFLLTCTLFISSILFAGNKDSWESKPTYDIIADSLKKYDIVNIFYKKYIEISYNSEFEINYTIHLKTKIFTQKGLEDYPEFYLPDAKLLEKVKARTIKPNGTSIELKRDDIKIIKTGSRSGYCKFVVPGANIGDEVEILISFTDINSIQIDDLFLNKGNFTLQSNLTVTSKDYIKIEAKTYNNLIAPKIQLSKNKKTYSWSLNNLEPIDKKDRVIIHNELPFVRIALRSIINSYGQYIPIEYTSWHQYGNGIKFNEYVGHRLSYDINLGAFITKHLGAETDNLSRTDRFNNLAKTISYINDSITLFYTEDTLELNKKLGDHIKNNKLPVESVYDLYSVILEMTYFDYYLCLGRNRYFGDIDVNFVNRSQITNTFFTFEFDHVNYFIFPKTEHSVYDFGEIPNELEGSKAIVFPRRGNATTTNIVTLPNSNKSNNSKTINTFGYVNTAENSIHERSKLITTGAWTTLYRNGYKNLKKDSIANDDIYKFIFHTSEDQIDSLTLEKNEHSSPFVFSLKFNKTEKNNLTQLSDSLKTISLDKIISHSISDSYTDETQNDIMPISFLFSDNIKYYLIFDKDVKLIEESNDNLHFENDFGLFDLQIKQLNPKTIFLFSKLILNKSNLKTTDSSPLYELSRKIREAQNINLSFKIIK
jgi:hypothetical protein